ncbi:MAG: hypothetical protein UY50_C0001G0018 [Parcubacteria group bacterium GW2011_GWA2_49_9]|nr:MAG: hypothetical protein UY50_C0001G0018 [Parcubacteria group bacterium GW2011_GWA2_49_9]
MKRPELPHNRKLGHFNPGTYMLMFGPHEYIEHRFLFQLATVNRIGYGAISVCLNSKYPDMPCAINRPEAVSMEDAYYFQENPAEIFPWFKRTRINRRLLSAAKANYFAIDLCAYLRTQPLKKIK